MNLIKELAEHLDFLELGKKDQNLFWGRMPDQPDDCTCVYSTDSGTPGSADGARIQILTRSKSTKTAYELSYEIACELDQFRGFLHGDGPDVSIEIINSAQTLGPDTLKREFYVTNIRVTYCG